MAKNNHITSDHWKVGGSGHSGENILHEVNKQQYTQAQKAQKDNAALIPNQDKQADETPAAKGGSERAGNATTSSNSSSSDY
ncbi:MAG TPA: hypothetical protein VF604_19720 [Pyrinomonadaceae bacterium]|jgi:hypothetical protein